MWTKALLIALLLFFDRSTALEENQGNVTECFVTAQEYEDVSCKTFSIGDIEIALGIPLFHFIKC